MPDLDLSRLAHDLAAMRSGRRPRREALQRLLALVDPAVRHARNIERLKLANAKAQLRMLDTRADHGPLQAAVEQSARRLALLDQRIVEAIAARKK